MGLRDMGSSEIRGRPMSAPRASSWHDGVASTSIEWANLRRLELPDPNNCRTWAAVLFAAVLGGCSGIGPYKEPPPPEPNLFPAKYKSEIADFMRTYLGNPTKVRDGAISEPALRPFGGSPHYISCIRYNPRDSKDQYIGIQENVAIFFGGRLNQFLPGNRELCANVAYQRFPEIEAMVP